MEHHINGTPEIVEIAEDENRLIVIEEYISGQTLREILDEGNLFPEEEAAALTGQLCRILQSLHTASPPIVHRDIKPSNIILTADGDVRLLDMNAAKQVRAGKAEDTALIGTIGYAAPEQYGFGSSTVQTDIYSVGVLLGEITTGFLPKEKMPGGEIGRIVRKCTAIDPARRYRDMPELMQALAACRGHFGESGGDEKKPSSSSPAQSIPEDRPFDRGFPDNNTSDGSASESGIPDGGFPDSNTSDGSASEGGIPDGGFPDGSAPDGGAPDGGFPDGSAPDGGVPGRRSARRPGRRGRYTLPGFRSKKPANILIASCAYIALLRLSLTYTAEGLQPGLNTWVERIIYLVCGFLILMFAGNYLDVWTAVGINRIKNVWIRSAVIFALIWIMIITMLMLMILTAGLMGMKT